jgi:hypothetical protein
VRELLVACSNVETLDLGTADFAPENPELILKSAITKQFKIDTGLWPACEHFNDE